MSTSLENTATVESTSLKKRFVFIVACVVAFLCMPTIGKWLYFECFTEVAELRKHVGKQVQFQESELTRYEGILEECHYEFNDKIGFFSLRISIEGGKTIGTEQIQFSSKAGISTSLSVFDVKKVKMISP